MPPRYCSADGNVLLSGETINHPSRTFRLDSLRVVRSSSLLRCAVLIPCCRSTPRSSRSSPTRMGLNRSSRSIPTPHSSLFTPRTSSSTLLSSPTTASPPSRIQHSSPPSFMSSSTGTDSHHRVGRSRQRLRLASPPLCNVPYSRLYYVHINRTQRPRLSTLFLPLPSPALVPDPSRPLSRLSNPFFFPPRQIQPSVQSTPNPSLTQPNKPPSESWNYDARTMRLGGDSRRNWSCSNAEPRSLECSVWVGPYSSRVSRHLLLPVHRFDYLTKQRRKKTSENVQHRAVEEPDRTKKTSTKKLPVDFALQTKESPKHAVDPLLVPVAMVRSSLLRLLRMARDRGGVVRARR